MTFPEEFKEMACNDIQRISNSGELPASEQLKLHRELDGRYQACIKNWYVGLWWANNAATSVWYGSLKDSPKSVRENLEMMKAKLETFRYQMNAVAGETPSQQINVTTNVNVTVTFEQVREKIEDMTALNREQTNEAIEKVNELEAISRENISRKSKWEKVKPIIAFAMDKGADLGIAILTLIVQMKLGA